MKKIFITLVLFFVVVNLKAQVIISPYVVYTDEHNKFGKLIVQNESYDSYEISISFIFGYPISDSLGNRTMKYIKQPEDSLPSINAWVKAFPKKFVLHPKERQTVRLFVKPPGYLKNGTYWTRIVTSSSPIIKEQDSSGNGVSAKLRFVLNQVTTVIFRKGIANTGLNISNAKISRDSTGSYKLLYLLKREGNSPFFGNFNLKIFNSKGQPVKDESDYTSVYFNMIRSYVLPQNIFKPGKYKAILEAVFNEKEDIPQSKMKNIPNVKNTFEFIIP